ncbi:MAG: thiamine-phosphate kinase [Candidatus Acidiferrum sp.]
MKPSTNENALVSKIERKFGSARSHALLLSFGDDAALWAPTKGNTTVLTCDWFLERTHFLRDKHPADSVGWKSLARAVSDIAAMGAMPKCFLLSLALPAELTGKWLDEFLHGLRRASRALHCELAGGDTTRRSTVLISTAVIGEIAQRSAILRAGAIQGDAIYVSGTLGEADLGLLSLRRRRGLARPTNDALRKHLYPRPRLELGQWLAKNRLATAMMDLSDGLSTDLPRLCAASRVGAIIDAGRLPVTNLIGIADARGLALHGGDDYELLFTVSKKNTKRLPPRFRGLPLTRIGDITLEKKILVAEGQKQVPLHSAGWDPFR